MVKQQRALPDTFPYNSSQYWYVSIVFPCCLCFPFFLVFYFRVSPYFPLLIIFLSLHILRSPSRFLDNGTFTQLARVEHSSEFSLLSILDRSMPLPWHIRYFPKWRTLQASPAAFERRSLFSRGCAYSSPPHPA